MTAEKINPMIKEIIKNQRVLLIAPLDEPARILRHVLLGYGLTVESCENEVDAARCLSGNLPFFIFISLSFPSQLGQKLIEEHKDNPEQIDRMVLLVNSSVQDSEIQACLSIGLHHLLSLPMRECELRFYLHNLFLITHYEIMEEEKCRSLAEQKLTTERQKELLSRYFPKELIESILDGRISSVPGGGTTQATVFFCDVRNSTSIAEAVEPDLFWNFLNQIFTDITDLIYGEGGTVNHFLGDGVLATFGSPSPLEDDAFHAVMTAYKIRKYFQNFNRFRPKFLENPVEVGIGLARGKIFIGNMGSVHQIQYTVLGDPVNLASRLESLTRSENADILLDGSIAAELGDRAVIRRLDVTAIRGKNHEVEVFALEEVKK